MAKTRMLPLAGITAVPFCLLFISSHAAPAPNTKDGTHAAQKLALAEFNSLIGGWRGVGQPRRNSTRGAWIETAEWVWDFSKHGVAVRYVVSSGKQLQSARITYDTKAKQYQLAATFADKTQRTYYGAGPGARSCNSHQSRISTAMCTASPSPG